MKNNYNHSEKNIKLIEEFFNFKFIGIPENHLFWVKESYLAWDNFIFVCSFSLGNINKIDKKGWRNIIVSNYLVSPDIQGYDFYNNIIDAKYLSTQLKTYGNKLYKGSLFVLLHGLFVMCGIGLINYPITIYIISWNVTIDSEIDYKNLIKDINEEGKESKRYINIIYLSYVEFFKNLDIVFKGISEEEAKSDFLGVNPIIMFMGLSWSNIVHLFKLNNININGGNISKRHQLSITNYRLSVFLYFCRIWNKNDFYKVTTNKILNSAKYDKNSEYLPYVILYNNLNTLLNLNNRYKKIESEIEVFKKQERIINSNHKSLLYNIDEKQNEMRYLEKRVKGFNEKLKIEGKSTKHKATLTGRKRIFLEEIHNLKKEIADNLAYNYTQLQTLNELNPKLSKLEKVLSEVTNSIEVQNKEVNSFKSKFIYENSGKIQTENPSISKRTYHSKAYLHSIQTGLFSKSNKYEKSIYNIINKSNLEVVSTIACDKRTHILEGILELETDRVKPYSSFTYNNNPSMKLNKKNIHNVINISCKKREYHTSSYLFLRSSPQAAISINPHSSQFVYKFYFLSFYHIYNSYLYNKAPFMRELIFRRKISYDSNKSSVSDMRIENKVSSGKMKIKIDSPLSYLDSIKDVIKNSHSDPEKAQWAIEELSIEHEKTKIEDQNYLLRRHSHGLHKLILEANKTLNILKDKKELKLKFPQLDGELNKLEYLLLTFSLGITYYGRLDWTAISSLIGNAITFQVYKSRLKQQILAVNKVDNKGEKIENVVTFNKFIENIGFTGKDYVKLGDFFLQLLSQYPHNIFDRVFEKAFYYSREQAKLIINPKHIKEIKNNLMIHPTSLPMISPPVEWSDTSFGGYLDNKNKQTNLITGSFVSHSHETKYLNNLHKTVNYLQNIKFGINDKLLDFINNEGSYLLDKLNNVSEEFQRNLTLKIALIYSKTPFYLPVNSDWRTRVYTQSFFISYQGGDLASALLNFWDGEALTTMGKFYFYIYGANNHNEDNISKKSLVDRLKWVENNYDKIINLDKELILRAENKFVFSAFCLNMKEIHNNNKAIIKTPVFLDATCSGIQHLAGMMRDVELGPLVNLSKSKNTDKPFDLYSMILDPVNKALNKFGCENVEYAALSLVKLTRKEVKPVVMTKVYNISTYGISQRLGSEFIQIHRKLDLTLENTVNTGTLSLFSELELENMKENDKDMRDNLYNKIEKGLSKAYKKDKTEYYAPGIKGKVLLTRKEIYKIADIINKQIFISFPSLNTIYDYLLDIAKLMVKLNLPLTWITPSGIKITQTYLKTKTTKLAIKLFGSKKTLLLREPIKERNNIKQINAIIPNIIHSLDAAHLMNVINTTAEKQIGPVITVHDCFGTHPNKMEALQFEVKKEFILLYSKDNFLETFHTRILQSIEDNNFKIVKEAGLPRFVLHMNENIEIPQLPTIGHLDLEDVKHSTYMIS